VVRAGFLFLDDSGFRDAVNYAWVADSLSKGEFSKVDASWTNLFCYWEALFRMLGLGPARGAVAASFVPGILLALPVAWMAVRCLVHPSPGWRGC